MKSLRTSAIRHMVYELKGGYLVLPGVIALALSVFAILFPGWESQSPWLQALGEKAKWLTPADPTTAQLLLGAIAGSCITVVSVVYSVLLVTLTFASMQFSPRILTSFLKDRVSQTTLGVFIGTFDYCLLLLPEVRSELPRLSLLCALLLSMTCLFFLIYFIHHIAIAIQVNYIIDRVARETESILTLVFGPPLGKGVHPTEPEPEPELQGQGEVLFSPRSGYLQFIDEEHLTVLAARADATIHVHRSVGKFLPGGAPCLTLRADHLLSVELKADCLKCLHLGPVRSLEGDVEFGILQMVDIALKAISPAVNDPSTAISCIDHLSGILLLAATLEPPSNQCKDSEGKVRVYTKTTSFPRLLDTAYNQIAPYGKTDMAVTLRLLQALRDIARPCRYPPYLSVILRKAQKVVRACTNHFPEEDCHELFKRLHAIEGLVARNSVPPMPAPEGPAGPGVFPKMRKKRKPT